MPSDTTPAPELPPDEIDNGTIAGEIFNMTDRNSDGVVRFKEMKSAFSMVSGERLTREKWVQMCVEEDTIPAVGLRRTEFMQLAGGFGAHRLRLWHKQLLMNSGPPPTMTEDKQNRSYGIKGAAVHAEKKRRRLEGVIEIAGKKANDVLAKLSDAPKKTVSERKQILAELQNIVSGVGDLFASQAAGSPAMTIDDMRGIASSVLVDSHLPMDENVNASALGVRSDTVLVEGDLLFSTQASLLNFMKGVMDLWAENKVPYCFDSAIDPAAKAAFQAAVDEFHKYVPCLRFEEVAVEAAEKCTASGPAVYVLSSKPGCFSYVGPVNFAGASQLLNLGTGCAFHGIAVHEIGHAVGMGHEHSRPDRDTHIKVHDDNVRDGQIAQFNIDDKSSVKEAYCYDSVMHYGATAFGKNQQLDDGTYTSMQTIEVKSGAQIGQRMGLAACDIVQLRNMYECPGTFQLPQVEELEVSGVCEYMALDGIYRKRGKTKDERPWYEHVHGSKFLYFDNDCDGQSSHPRWIFDSQQPSDSAAHDLDGDGQCLYSARLNDQDKTAPLGKRDWRVYCGGTGWEDLSVSIQNVSNPNSTAMDFGDGSNITYVVPQLLETEPALEQDGITAGQMMAMSLQFSTPVKPGVAGLSTGIVPKEFASDAFADVVLDGTNVSIFLPQPLAVGTRYNLKLAYGCVENQASSGRSMEMSTFAFSTALESGQTQFSEKTIIWNQYGAWVEDGTA
jgi:astacin